MFKEAGSDVMGEGHTTMERDGDGHGPPLSGQVLFQSGRQSLLVQRLPHP